MLELSDKEKLLESLRDKEHLTFQQIGAELGISSSMSLALYQRIKCKRTAEKRCALFSDENKQVVSVEFTLYELAMVQKLLHAYEVLLKLQETPLPDIENTLVDLRQHVFYKDAEKLSLKLSQAKEKPHTAALSDDVESR